MSNEPRLFDLRHDGRLDRRTIAKCTRQHNYGVVGSLEKLCSLTFTVPRWRICESITSRDVEWCAPRGSQRTMSQMIRLSWSEVGCTGVSRPRRQTSTYFSGKPNSALAKAVFANAARRADQLDTVASVFDVRRAYFCAEDKRDTFVELSDCEREVMYVIWLVVTSWSDELR